MSTHLRFPNVVGSIFRGRHNGAGYVILISIGAGSWPGARPYVRVRPYGSAGRERSMRWSYLMKAYRLVPEVAVVDALNGKGSLR